MPSNSESSSPRYAPVEARGPDRFDGQLLAFAEDLRREGVAIGTSEILDAFQALGHIGWTEQTAFKEALATTLAKSPEDRRVFELVFERFFFRAAEAEAARRNIAEGQRVGAAEDEIDLDTLRQQIAAALRDGT
ncbi:MAG: CoxE, partial [Solirubrobacterales bacterium]|nr:CoxE [Solirubrobacterales bacterium]